MVRRLEGQGGLWEGPIPANRARPIRRSAGIEGIQGVEEIKGGLRDEADMKAGRAAFSLSGRHEVIRQMRKVTAGLFSSIDGVVEAPNEWQPAFDDEMGAAWGFGAASCLH